MPFERRMLDKMAGDPWTHEVPPCCPKCGYNLTGIEGTRCPECGAMFARTTVADHAHELQTRLRRMSNMNELVKVGLKIAVVGGAALGLGLLRDPLDSFGRFVAVVCAVPSIGLGLNVFRARQLPLWAVSYLPARPNYILGVLTALAGLALIIVSVLAA